MLSGANGFAEVGYGNFNTFSAEGAVEETLIDGQVGVRLAANYLKGNGQIENVYPGGADPNSQDSRQGFVSQSGLNPATGRSISRFAPTRVATIQRRRLCRVCCRSGKGSISSSR